MKIPIVIVLFCILIMNPANNNIIAQSIPDSLHQKDSITNAHDADTSVEDDEFNLFLFVFAVAFLGAVLGAAVIGAFVALMVLLFLFALVSLGVLSVSVLTGLYKRSFQTGFKTFLIIVCGIGGITIGTIGFWLIAKLFDLNISNSTTTIAGSISGGLGGSLLGIAVFKTMRVAIKYFKQQFKIDKDTTNE